MEVSWNGGTPKSSISSSFSISPTIQVLETPCISPIPGCQLSPSIGGNLKMEESMMMSLGKLGLKQFGIPHLRWFFGVEWCKKEHRIITNLVGGFNPLKNISQWEGLSHILWKIKNVPNHQSVIIYSIHGSYGISNSIKSHYVLVEFNHRLFWLISVSKPLRAVEPTSVAGVAASAPVGTLPHSNGPSAATA